MVDPKDIPEVERAGDRNFREELGQFLDEEASRERRLHLIEKRAVVLMQPGEDYDPWTPKHFFEALNESTDVIQKLAFEMFMRAVHYKCADNDINHLALIAMRDLVTHYWKQQALTKAEEEFWRNLGFSGDDQ